MSRKRTRLTKDQISIKVAAVTDAVKKGSSVIDACKEFGIPHSTYSRHKNKVKRERKVKEPTITQVEAPNFLSNDGKSLIIITDDSRIIAAVIDSFTKG